MAGLKPYGSGINYKDILPYRETSRKLSLFRIPKSKLSDIYITFQSADL